MFNKKRIIFLCICCLSTMIFSQVVNYNNRTILEIHKDYIHQGKISPFLSGPLLPGQVNRASDTIKSSHYIPNTNRSGAKIATYFNPSVQLFSDEVLIETGEANNAIDYTKNYLKNPQWGGFNVSFFNKNGIGGNFCLDFASEFNNNHFQTNNIEGRADKNFLHESSIYFDNEWISLIAGRLKTQMSFPYADALFFNNNIPYTDTIAMSIPFGNYFNLQWRITNTPSVKSSFQKDLELGNEVGSTSPDYFYGFEHDDFPSTIVNTYQRFGFQNSIIKAGLSLNVYLVRRNNRFEFIDFLPFAEWHASDVLPNNMSMGIDFGIVPVKNLLLDFQIGFDEINGNSIGLGDTSIPTIWKAIGTIQNTLFREKISILFSSNIGYTHYLWGNFTGTSVGDAGQAGLARALHRNHTNRAMYMPHSSEFGPGTFWVTQEAVINFNDTKLLENLTIIPKNTFLVFEPTTNLIETEYEERKSEPPKSIYYSFELPISYEWRTLEATINPSVHVVGLNRPTKTWFELRLSFKAFFSVSLFEENNVVKHEFEY